MRKNPTHIYFIQSQVGSFSSWYTPKRNKIGIFLLYELDLLIKRLMNDFFMGKCKAVLLMVWKGTQNTNAKNCHNIFHIWLYFIGTTHFHFSENSMELKKWYWFNDSDNVRGIGCEAYRPLRGILRCQPKKDTNIAQSSFISFLGKRFSTA